MLCVASLIVEPNVFDNHLLQACIQQQQMLEQMVKPPNITLDREALADAIQVFLNYADLLERTQRRLLFKAGRVNHPETRAIGSQVSSLLEAAIARGGLLKQAVDLAGNINHVPVVSDGQSVTDELHRPIGPVDMSVQLAKALQRLTQLLELHVKSWPQERMPYPEDVAKAVERGETQELDEAFAEALHLDGIAWSELVARHKSAKMPRRVVDA